MVPSTPSRIFPEPMHIPRDAVAQIVVAVVIPATLFSSLKITPAPRKPIPVIIFAANRSGFATPIFIERIVNTQAPKLTSMKVRSPARLITIFAFRAYNKTYKNGNKKQQDIFFYVCFVKKIYCDHKFLILNNELKLRFFLCSFKRSFVGFVLH